MGYFIFIEWNIINGYCECDGMWVNTCILSA